MKDHVIRYNRQTLTAYISKTGLIEKNRVHFWIQSGCDGGTFEKECLIS